LGLNTRDACWYPSPSHLPTLLCAYRSAGGAANGRRRRAPLPCSQLLPSAASSAPSCRRHAAGAAATLPGTAPRRACQGAGFSGGRRAALATRCGRLRCHFHPPRYILLPQQDGRHIRRGVSGRLKPRLLPHLCAIITCPITFRLVQHGLFPETDMTSLVAVIMLNSARRSNGICVLQHNLLYVCAVSAGCRVPRAAGCWVEWMLATRAAWQHSMRQTWREHARTCSRTTFTASTSTDSAISSLVRSYAADMVSLHFVFSLARRQRRRLL